MRVLVIAFLILAGCCFGQSSIKRGTIKVKKVPSDTSIYRTVDEVPSFPGGDSEMMKFIQKNVNYPQTEKEAGVSGTVVVTFVIEPDGSITNIKILKSVAGGKGLDLEALRVVMLMPKWTPGKNKGRAVRVSFYLPINFRLK